MEKSPNLKGYISTVRIFNDINSLEPKFKKKEKNRRNVFICLGLTRNMKNIEKKTTLTSAGRKDKHKKFFSNYFFFFFIHSFHLSCFRNIYFYLLLTENFIFMSVIFTSTPSILRWTFFVLFVTRKHFHLIESV